MVSKGERRVKTNEFHIVLPKNLQNTGERGFFHFMTQIFQCSCVYYIDDIFSVILGKKERRN
jgi:hypothetical protein